MTLGSKSPVYLNALPEGYRLEEYEFNGVLGAGGFGITYRGFDHHLAKSVAIKEYLPNDLAVRRGVSVLAKSETDQSDFEWGLDRFLDEARVLARFDHPNIIHVYRYFQAHGTGYIVMEYADGEALSELLDKRGTLSPSELNSLLFPLLDGLEEVHRNNYLHRDIKPGNIIVRNDGSPVILDFGAARQAINAKSRSVTAIVTPGYAPIEQYSTKGNQGPWTDIYALAAVVSRAMTGEKPQDATERVYEAEGGRSAVSVSARAKGWDERFVVAIEQGLSFKEEDRPQSVAEWRSLLDGSARIEGHGALDEPFGASAKSQLALAEGLQYVVNATKSAYHDIVKRIRQHMTTARRLPPSRILYVAGSVFVTSVAAVLLTWFAIAPQTPDSAVEQSESSITLPTPGQIVSPSELISVLDDLAVSAGPTDVEVLKRHLTGQIETHISEDDLELASELLDVLDSEWSDDSVLGVDGRLRDLLSSAQEVRGRRVEAMELVVKAQTWSRSDPEQRAEDIGEILDGLGRAIDLDVDSGAIDIMEGIRRDRVAAIRAALRSGDLSLAQRLINSIEGRWQGDDEVENVREDVERTATIRQLLASANNLVRQGRLTRGERNAVAEFNAVLRLDPDDREANLGLQNVEERLAALVEESVDDGDLDAARRHLSSLVQMNASHQDLNALQAKVADVEARLIAAAPPDVRRDTEATVAPQAMETIVKDEEDRLWDSVKDSCRAGDLQRYLKAYPRGRYKDDAWTKMSACSKADARRPS